MKELNPFSYSQANHYPLVAIIGQERIRRAVEIVLVNPDLGGLLVSGRKGTAKTTMIRGIQELLWQQKILEIPLNTTEEMLFGCLDVEKTISTGQRNFAQGLLSRGNGQILYIDEINLFSSGLLTLILNISAQKEIQVEREGLSHRESLSYLLVGTMNPQEGTLSPALLDRFGICVEAEELSEMSQRLQIVKRVLEYEGNPEAFVSNYQEETCCLREKIREAKELVSQVSPSVGMMQLAASFSAKANCAGHRGEIYLLEAAKAIAALEGRTYLLPKDIEEAATFTLAHRQRSVEEPPELLPNQSDREASPESSNTSENDSKQASDDLEPTFSEELKSAEESPIPPPKDDPENSKSDEEEISQGEAPEKVQEISPFFSFAGMQIESLLDKKKRKGSGKRIRTRTDQRQGRYVASTDRKTLEKDLAFDATIRAAAIFQKKRKENKKNRGVVIQSQDFRYKLREKRIGSNFIFLVDASGSMGAKERMKAVKGAVLKMLLEAYQKRDRVGIITFRRDRAEILLPITRSIDLAQKCLRTMPTGGKTPLAEGLLKTFLLLQKESLREKDQEPILILITDGRVNGKGMHSIDPIEDAKKIAKKIGQMSISTVVINTEKDFIKVGISKEIASYLGASYYHFDELSDGKILHIIRHSQ